MTRSPPGSGPADHLLAELVDGELRVAQGVPDGGDHLGGLFLGDPDVRGEGGLRLWDGTEGRDPQR